MATNKKKMKQKHLWAAIPMLLASSMAYGQKVWTLHECLDYALANNIQLQQKKIAVASDHEDVRQSKAALFPSASFSTNQNVSWRPFAESTINLTNGSMTTNRNNVTYNGSYGINANWTVWNGNRNINTIKQNKLTERMAEMEVEQQANNIQEQIAQLYVQILYEAEAVHVCEEILKASEMQRDRAQTMVDVGSLARVDLVQLEAQVSQDQYSLVQAQSQLANYKLQLKQLLEIHDAEPFEVATPNVTDEQVLAAIPDELSIYSAALSSRPEIQAGILNIEASELAISTARAGYKPTVSLTASIGSSNSSGQHTEFTKQIKNNLSNAVGLTISMPLFDNFQTRTNIRKAKYAKQTSELNLLEQQKQLYSTIENYWLNTTTSRQQYIYAKANVQSMQESYNLVSEQFNLGLKNIVELTTGKNNLLQAQQQMLQTKYMTLLNSALLNFYAGERIKL